MSHVVYLLWKKILLFTSELLIFVQIHRAKPENATDC